MSTNITEVRAFWNANPCQSRLSQEAERRRYFDEISRKRFHGREWHIPIIAKFDSFRGKNVLEIGCGVGTDGIEFAKNGANYGVDLTPNQWNLRGRFEVFNAGGRLKSQTLRNLPF
jgi:2-polyprenyl-3-methyl-5-hydroxy-6-metoxy-1,4-benzoquinol methylase